MDYAQVNGTHHSSKSAQQPTSKIIAECISVAAIPAVVMLLGSLFAILSPKQPSKNLAHAIQHLAAGILLSAIALELMPHIASANGPSNLIGIIVGFSLGAIVMISLPLLLKEDEADGESHQKLEEECEEGRRADSADKKATKMVPTTSHTSQFDNSSNASGTAKVKVLVRRMKSRIFRIFDSERSETMSNANVGPFPAVFAAAVYIDSAMDGILVGISLLSGASAGVFMAVAMASEMGFLGLSFALSLVGRPKWQTVPAIVCGPLCMILGAVVGGAAANALAANEPLLVACTSFGVAALLYMVTEELLVSAHEDGFGHAWWVDIQVFVGFLTAVVLEKLMSPAE